VLPIPAPSGVPATGEVAPGVHITSVAGFVVMAVVFDTFVVAVEAPEVHPGFELIPPARSQASVSVAHLAWLRGIARGKPIRYAIISHHHSDHLGGARTLAATGATLLVSPGDVSITRRNLAAPDTIAGERVEGVSGRRTIEDGSRRLDVIQVGANPHTDENLVVWLPRERMLFQGDLFYYAGGSAFPPAGRERMNRFFAGWLTERGMQPLAIYGVHNDGAAGPETLSRARRPDL
jgi:glyoxylase-like metal-dependent hydrolase (beta-lactamase superfamily II)